MHFLRTGGTKFHKHFQYAEQLFGQLISWYNEYADHYFA